MKDKFRAVSPRDREEPDRVIDRGAAERLGLSCLTVPVRVEAGEEPPAVSIPIRNESQVSLVFSSGTGDAAGLSERKAGRMIDPYSFRLNAVTTSSVSNEPIFSVNRGALFSRLTKRM